MLTGKVERNVFRRFGVCVFLGIAFVWIFSSFTLTAQAGGKTFTEYFETGKVYLKEGKFEEAAKELKESLRLNPRLDEIDKQLAKETQARLEKVNVGLKKIAEERRYREEKEAAKKRIKEEKAAKLQAAKEKRERLVQEKKAAALAEKQRRDNLAAQRRAEELKKREEKS